MPGHCEALTPDPGDVLVDYRIWLVERIARVSAYRAQHGARSA